MDLVKIPVKDIFWLYAVQVISLESPVLLRSKSILLLLQICLQHTSGSSKYQSWSSLFYNSILKLEEDYW